MDILDCLMKTGFTKHEAMLYITLGKEGALTGYEASKLSGIPRSNAYLALAGLVDKGGALRIDGDTSKYSAVPASELVYNLRKHQEEAFEFIEKNAPVRVEAAEPYYTVAGRENIINKMSYMIANTKDRIYISTSPDELEYVKRELSQACSGGLKVVIITSDGFDLKGATIYRNEKQPGQIRLISDTAYVLTGELRASGESTALYSGNRNLIDVIRDSLRNEITLIGLKSIEGTAKKEST